MRLRPVLALVTVLAVLTLVPTTTAEAAAPPGTPTATHVAGIKLVGPLFRDGLSNDHGCTASVLAAPQHDLILTAAHCVSGSGAGQLFAPGYDRGATPYGVWTTVAAYVDPAWLRSQDPQHDYAILRVAHQIINGHRVGVAEVTGAAEFVAFAPGAGTELTVPAYPAGRNDQPIDCAVRTYLTSGYPSFDCAGYFGGTSGAPWLIQHGRSYFVAGVIGGLHQGGCVDYTSYSSAFGPDTYRLWLRAVLARPADTVPVAGSDGC